ncbi:MAG: sulfotransferase [Planctomycetes bacterium]|nr:sulfotransferase [Planctomycetota bacterium]MBI3843922.1 sulfotransferase [Planctomycetota bacterium]
MALSYPLLLPKTTQFFFIAGSMKSGTTWLMNVLDAHPDIVCRGEMHALEPLDGPMIPMVPTLESISAHATALRQWYYLPNSAWNVPYRDNDKQAETVWQLDRDFVRFHFEWTIARLLDAEGRGVPKMIGDKSPMHTQYAAHKLDRYFGVYQPWVIHIVRDPRDVAVSRWFHHRKLQYEKRHEFVGGFEDAADEAACRRLIECPDDPVAPGEPFFHNPRFLRQALREWISVNECLAIDGPRFFGTRYVCVRYEDMKLDFEESVGELLDRFGLEGGKAALEQIRNATDVSRGAQRPRVFREGGTGGWKRYLSAEDLASYEEIAAPLARQFGYANESGPFIPV